MSNQKTGKRNYVNRDTNFLATTHTLSPAETPSRKKSIGDLEQSRPSSSPTIPRHLPVHFLPVIHHRARGRRRTAAAKEKRDPASTPPRSLGDLTSTRPGKLVFRTSEDDIPSQRGKGRRILGPSTIKRSLSSQTRSSDTQYGKQAWGRKIKGVMIGRIGSEMEKSDFGLFGYNA